MLWKRWLMIWQKTFVFKHGIFSLQFYTSRNFPLGNYILDYIMGVSLNTHKIRSTDTWTTDDYNN